MMRQKRNLDTWVQEPATGANQPLKGGSKLTESVAANENMKDDLTSTELDFFYS